MYLNITIATESRYPVRCCEFGGVAKTNLRLFGVVAMSVMLPCGGNLLLVVEPGISRQARCVCSSGLLSVVTLDEGANVLTGRERLIVHVSGAKRIWTFDANQFCSWLAFVDSALDQVPVTERTKNNVVRECVPREQLNSSAVFSHWLALQALSGNAPGPLLMFLRSSESYRLTSFLLDASDDNDYCLMELSERYGVSYSHFRRLCRRALGGPAKPKLRAWRAARAVLQLIDGNESVLQIAIKNGYTSASHIATDIKGFYGMTPTEIKRVHEFLP
ncbi:helix-turn-helix domain-containing protein [Burkholderia sp. Bp9126]|nr:helix-turn-helix domain-containing protein [Burkholderia sp. Bp9126]